MKAIAVVALSVGLASAVVNKRHSEIAARQENVTIEARQGCAGTGGWDPNCRVPGTQSISVLNTIYQVLMDQGASSRVQEAAYECCLVESNCNNIACGHADSIGIMQQRPCAGVWGTYNEIMNPYHAALRFVQEAKKCEDRYSWYSPPQIAQCVQQSDIPDAYYGKVSQARTLLSQARSRHGGGGGTGGTTGGTTNIGTTPGGSGSCTNRQNPRSGDTAAKFAARYGLTFAKLREWNSNINSSGSNLSAGTKYCVGKSGSGGTTGGTTSGGCTSWQNPRSGDTATKFAGRYGLSFAKLRSWNPKINSSGSNLSTGTKYCVKH